MKTNRFDVTLRRKLESIEPDFQDQDWDKWHAFQQHASPTFWQTYGHWLGYAVATLSTAVMVVLYVNQSNQNQALLKEMQQLKQQITTSNQAVRAALDSSSTDGAKADEAPPTKASSVRHADTVYIVERRTVYLQRPAGVDAIENPTETRFLQEVAEIPVASEKKNAGENLSRKKAIPSDIGMASPKTEALPGENSFVSANETRVAINIEANLPVPNRQQESVYLKKTTSAESAESRVPDAGALVETGPLSKATKPDDTERLDLGEIAALPRPAYSRPATVSYRRLQSRLPRSARAIPNQHLAKSESTTGTRQKPDGPFSGQKVEKVAREERLLPNFGLGLPFRVGVGQQWEGPTKSFGLWNEVLLGRHFSVQTGLNWLKLEEQKFYNDRVFRDKTREDFRKKHAKPLPPSFEIFNITLGTTLLRVPLNLTYRGELSRHFALFGGAGTHLNLRARQTLSFDFKRPTNDFGQHTAERAVAVPLINNMNLLLGVEKRWSPIVLQASTFFTVGLKASPYLNERTGVGAQVKILYELGPAKKK